MSEPKAESAAPQGAANAPQSASLSSELLDLLVCPLGKAPLRLEGESLICTRCGARFKIQDGIPELIIETAELPAGVERIEDLACAAGPAAE